MDRAQPPRQQLHGYVSTDARNGWYRFAEEHGTNVTALLEAIGLLLSEHTKAKRSALPLMLRRLVDDARDIASSRSGRAR